MTAFLNFILRIVLLAAGLVVAASMAAAFLLVLALWGARAAWSRLTGRPAMPFIFRMDPRRGFAHMYRGDQAASRTPRADSVRPRRKILDVSDVEPKAPEA